MYFKICQQIMSKFRNSHKYQYFKFFFVTSKNSLVILYIVFVRLFI